MPKTWRRYKKFMQHWRRYFISPAETNFAWVMGCRVYRFEKLKDRAGNPFTIIIYNDWFKQYGCIRQYDVRGYHVDFAFKNRCGIEIDGKYDNKGNKIHDIVHDQERDEHLAKVRWRVLRVPAIKLNPFSEHFAPREVKADAYAFVGAPKTKRKSGQST